MTQKIYLFSGLGADERVFHKIDFSGFDPVFIGWIEPLKNESLSQYAQRISKVITTPDPVIIGLSFGGMVAVEVARHSHVQKLILISSAKTKYEIPKLYRLAGKLGLIRLMPAGLMKRSGFLTNWFFGTETRAEKRLLHQVLSDTDPVFLKWALHAITHWDNIIIPQNTTHIHGTKDRILPFRKIAHPVPVEGGGHFMVLNKTLKIL